MEKIRKNYPDIAPSGPTFPQWRADRERQEALFAEFFQGQYPANTLVEITALAEEGLDVEIEAIVELG